MRSYVLSNHNNAWSRYCSSYAGVKLSSVICKCALAGHRFIDQLAILA